MTPSRRSPFRARRPRWRRVASTLALACAMLAGARGARAQTVGATIVEVQVEQEGEPVTDRVILDLLETTVGRPLSMRDVRESFAHLSSVNRFEDVWVWQEPVDGGVRVRYRLFPVHLVDRLELRGFRGVPDSALRRAVTDRFGTTPPAARVADVVETLRAVLSAHGYPQARLSSEIVKFHKPDRASMVIAVEPGARAAITAVSYAPAGVDESGTMAGLSEIKAGQPYEAAEVDSALEKYVEAVKARGYYEARATHAVTFAATGAQVRIDVQRGPHVVIAFTGDVLPEKERERLVRVRTEGSVDEDLLEDASRSIERYLQARGYRDARAPYRRVETDDALTITFDVTNGPRSTVAEVAVTGNALVPSTELLPSLRLRSGEPFVQATLDAALLAIRNLYVARGFTRAQVGAAVSDLATSSATNRSVAIAVSIVEGPRAHVRSVTVRGNLALTETEIRGWISTKPGQPYSEAGAVADRDRLELEYLNRGYESVSIVATAALADGNTQADIVLTVTEGPQVYVDRIIVLGNYRTSIRTIEHEIVLKSGQPLGYTARLESQRQLSALGLFRRVTITELGHMSESRRDVLVQVEEAKPTVIEHGAGLEVSSVLRTGSDGRAEERFEFVPRGSFQISRRNMWGKNRSASLFTRAALRSRELAGVRDTPTVEPPDFYEYRVFGTFYEPRVFNTRADVRLTGILDQAIRSSFNFRTREIRVESGGRVAARYDVLGRYSVAHTELFDERFDEDEKPLIDRVFPQVRISKIAGSVIRDSRDDVLDPSHGHLLIAEGDLAARTLGSEVGFAKTYLQGFTYLRLPATRRMIAAFGVRLGLAHGFAREVPRMGTDGTAAVDGQGTPIVDVVQDLPASERFFAGGDTTVRGFSLDRLGNARTITATGFPTGGNGVVILNGELRASVVGPWQGVVFIDAGNVFPRAGALALTDLRTAAGAGVRYKSPLGPVRIDLGFNLERRALIPGRLERGYVLHVSLGQAF